MALETTVRPRASLEFDLDLVCLLLDPNGINTDPQELFRKVRARISLHGIFRGLLVSHDKCIRLSYANDFHLDVMGPMVHTKLECPVPIAVEEVENHNVIVRIGNRRSLLQ